MAGSEAMRRQHAARPIRHRPASTINAQSFAAITCQRTLNEADAAGATQTLETRVSDLPPTNEEFDRFWAAQHGVRSLFLMDEIAALPAPVAFKVYGRALEWGYPMGVGYRYLSVPQSVLLLRLAAMPPQVCEIWLQQRR